MCYMFYLTMCSPRQKNNLNYRFCRIYKVSLQIKPNNVEITYLCARRISGITFITYAQNQKVGKPNILQNLWEQANQRS